MQRRWIGSPDYRAAIDMLKATRVELGLSQREVAKRIGKPVSFVNKIELIERRVDIIEFIQICRALDIKPGVLIDQIAAATRMDPDF